MEVTSKQTLGSFLPPWKRKVMLIVTIQNGRFHSKNLERPPSESRYFNSYSRFWSNVKKGLVFQKEVLPILTFGSSPNLLEQNIWQIHKKQLY